MDPKSEIELDVLRKPPLMVADFAYYQRDCDLWVPCSSETSVDDCCMDPQMHQYSIVIIECGAGDTFLAGVGCLLIVKACIHPDVLEASFSSAASIEEEPLVLATNLSIKSWSLFA